MIVLKDVLGNTLKLALFAVSVIWMAGPQVCGQDAEHPRSLLDAMEKDGLTQSDIEASTPVLQQLASGELSEDEAKDRLIGVADGRLVKYLSNRLFRNFFRRADPADFIEFLKSRGLNTERLEELQSTVNFFFRPQTEGQAAQWEFATNTLFIPVEFCQDGTDKIRANLRPHEINTVIHELDHAEKDFQNDLLSFRGKSLGRKIHAGISWGTILAVLGLAGTTVVGNLHRFQRVMPVLGKLSKFAFLTSPHMALGILVGSAAFGAATGLVYHVFSSDDYAIRGVIEEENFRQIEKIIGIINADASQMLKPDNVTHAAQQTMPRRMVHASRLGLWGILVGGALGLFLGELGLGPKLLGRLRILKALNYTWALAVTCGTIGAIGLGSVGAWQTNTFAKMKAWEISGYFAGNCAQEVLEGMQDIESHNTRMLRSLSREDLERLQQMDENGQFKLLLPERLLNMPVDQLDLREHPLTQLTLNVPRTFRRLGTINRDFHAYFVGSEIEFPYDDHPKIFESLFKTCLGLHLDELAYDQQRGEYSYRGLANFLERSELPYFQRLRDRVRRTRAKIIEEL